MKKFRIFFVLLALISTVIFSSESPFKKLEFLLGQWEGTGSGFGNSKSVIKSGFILIMEGKYLKVKKFLLVQGRVGLVRKSEVLGTPNRKTQFGCGLLDPMKDNKGE